MINTAAAQAKPKQVSNILKLASLRKITMNKVGHVRSRRCAVFLVYITILSASSGSDRLPPYAARAK
jgi:hypothetical protein